MKTTRTHLVLFLLAAFGLMLVAGCAHEPAGVRPAAEIFQEAVDQAKKGNVDKATEKYMEVRTYYPGDDLAKKALLATADLYYDQELYESALTSYQEFRLLYPTDPEAGYALFRSGMCNFEQMSTFDRDQTQTVKAIQTLDSFVTSYPTSPFVQAAKDNVSQARTVLAKHYVYIGKFYLKKKDYVGACKRFQYVRSNFTGMQLDDDLNALINTACSSGLKAPGKKSRFELFP